MFAAPVRDKAAVEQRHHSGYFCLALHRLLVRHASHRLGRVRLRAPQDLLHSGLQQGRQVPDTLLRAPQRSLTFSTVPLLPCVFLQRNYVSYLIPMAIFNMAIQVFVVMSSYQSIAQKFKKTGNPRVSNTNASAPIAQDEFSRLHSTLRDMSIHSTGRRKSSCHASVIRYSHACHAHERSHGFDMLYSGSHTTQCTLVCICISIQSGCR